MTANVLEDKLWLTANSKESEFELFCKQNDLDQSEPMSLKIFINEKKSETISQKENNAESFYASGFFIQWETKAGTCRIFTKDPHEAAFLYAILKGDPHILLLNKYDIKGGYMEKSASWKKSEV